VQRELCKGTTLLKANWFRNLRPEKKKGIKARYELKKRGGTPLNKDTRRVSGRLPKNPSAEKGSHRIR